MRVKIKCLGLGFWRSFFQDQRYCAIMLTDSHLSLLDTSRRSSWKPAASKASQFYQVTLHFCIVSSNTMWINLNKAPYDHTSTCIPDIDSAVMKGMEKKRNK